MVEDISHKRITDLKKTLHLNKLPKRIECYDISNIQGKFATGSMVVFENGQPQKAQYRRFRIKFSKRPDDYQMIKEMLSRRFKNNWDKPDLIVIDGGKGQLNSALSITNRQLQPVQVVSIAKKFEKIFTPNNDLPITLPQTSPSRLLLQSLRDEAHRFAITYHRLLRSKNMINLSRS